MIESHRGVEPTIGIRVTYTLLAALTLAGCQDRDRAGDSSALIISEVDTIIPPSAALFEKPSEIAVSQDGRIYVTDISASTVFIFDTAGRQLGNFGRSGAGPGEFQRPRTLTLLGDSLVLIDGGNGRLQFLTRSGDYLHSMPLPPYVRSGATTISPSGELLASTNGRDSTRAVLMTYDGTVISRYGAPRVVLRGGFDFQEVKQRIREGEVPDMFRAITLPVMTQTGNVWLVGVADAEVTRFAPDGHRLWAVTFDSMPEIVAIRERFFELNRADSNQNRFFPLDNVAAARARGDSLWILLRMPEEESARILVLGPDGRQIAQIGVPGATGVRSFAFASSGQALYLMDFYRGALLRVALPHNLASS